MRNFFWILALLTASFAAAADDNAKLQNLYSAVSTLSQEQQAIFQQFQMLQELRRDNDRATYATQLRPLQYATDVPSYSDIVQAQRDTARRGEELARQTDQLYTKYNEIGAKKAQLKERILELTLPE